jgi:hypothetical protein
VGPGFLLEISNLDSCTQFARCITAKTASAFIDHTLSELPCPKLRFQVERGGVPTVGEEGVD